VEGEPARPQMVQDSFRILVYEMVGGTTVKK
jgi:hypothetical protein